MDDEKFKQIIKNPQCWSSLSDEQRKDMSPDQKFNLEVKALKQKDPNFPYHEVMLIASRNLGITNIDDDVMRGMLSSKQYSDDMLNSKTGISKYIKRAEKKQERKDKL
ncbi:MAG: hypothetical protein LBM01_01955 [Christensenellaceae bacterium]|jgi:hypothetical protein|nr:hypothetical protein [Christensenellaceae bacterium]